MYNYLCEIQQKHNDIKKKILSPDIIKNIIEYNKLIFELNKIKEIVEVFSNYKKTLSLSNQAKEILKSEKNLEIINLAKSEIETSEKVLLKLEKKIKMLLIPQDPNNNKNVIIEIRGAAGGVEANIFAVNLFDVYKKWSYANNMQLSLINNQKSDSGGASLIVFKVKGDKVYSKLKFESGVHRVQRIPTTETQGRVHTSTATVVVMPEADETADIEINTSEIKIDTFRSSGAGGQSVNTTDSAVRITHIPTKIVVSSQNERSQLQNRDTCMKLLKTKLFNLEIKKRNLEDASFRMLAGSGSRSEKVRTYNFPQDRVTDHRINVSVSLKSFMDGKMQNIIETLQAAEKAEKMKQAKID